MENRVEQLYQAFIFELTKAMALPQTKYNRGVVSAIFGKATFRFSEIIMGFDQQIEKNDLMAATHWLLQYFASDHRAFGTEIIPKEGPLILASNHPASFDAIAIAAHLPRSDFRVIIGEIPPYHYLPHISQHAIFSPPAINTFGRMQTVRRAIRHLKQGGALLIFPRGSIEPDPSFMPNPDKEFHQWSRSLEIFIRNVPETQVLVTMVSGVISPKIFHHPFTWFRRSQPDRQRLAFIYQMIRQAWSGKELFGLRPRVTFGELLVNDNQRVGLAEIEQAAKRTLAKHLSLIQSSF